MGKSTRAKAVGMALCLYRGELRFYAQSARTIADAIGITNGDAMRAWRIAARIKRNA